MSSTHASATSGAQPDAGGDRRTAGPGASRADDGDARRTGHQDPPDGRVDAVITGAARLTDAVMEIGEALVAALIGAVTGAGKTAAGIWVADRPRRQAFRMHRRRKWLQRRGWWRVAVIAELIGVGAFLGARAAVRATRGVPAGAAHGARDGWATGRGNAQDRRGTRHDARRPPAGPRPAWGTPGPGAGTTPTSSGPASAPTSPSTSTSSEPGEGEPIVDAEILCGRLGCGTVLAPEDQGPLCPACRTAQAAGAADDVQVTVAATPGAEGEARWANGQPLSEADLRYPWKVTNDRGEVVGLYESGPDAVSHARLCGGAVNGRPYAATPPQSTAEHAGDEEITPDPWPVRTAEQNAFDGLGLNGGPVHVCPHHADDWQAGEASAVMIDQPAEDADQAELRAAAARTAALRAAGWTGPVDAEGFAVTDPASCWGLSGERVTYPSGLAEALDWVAWQATDDPRLTCCRCDPARGDDVRDCRCVIGQGASRDRCTCGPWDLPAALTADDDGEDTGEIDGREAGGQGGRVTCHSCQDWADHAHHPWTGARIPMSAYNLRQVLRGDPTRRPLAPPAAEPTAATTPSTSVDHPADGPGQTGTTPAGPDQHDHEHDDQEDGMTTGTSNGTTDMTITSGAGGTQVQGGSRMGGQLTAVGDLRAETTELRKWAEVSLRMLQDLEQWAAGLPEQVAAADWSTEAVTQAAVGLAEARTVEEVRSGITTLLSAAAEAERLGEQLAAGGARRNVAGLRPQ